MSQLKSVFHFFAYVSRMKLIDRWALMRCTQKENVQEHSLQVAMIAHVLTLIKNKFYGGNLSPEKVATYAIYHDATEVLTGDLPTPVKYFSNDIRNAYQEIEGHAVQQLLSLLPADFQEDYRKLLQHDEADQEIHKIIKSADTLAAYVRCLEEQAAGNHEFRKAKKTIELKVKAICDQREVQYFVEHFVPSFSLSIDEISEPLNS